MPCTRFKRSRQNAIQKISTQIIRPNPSVCRSASMQSPEAVSGGISGGGSRHAVAWQHGQLALDRSCARSFMACCVSWNAFILSLTASFHCMHTDDIVIARLSSTHAAAERNWTSYCDWQHCKHVRACSMQDQGANKQGKIGVGHTFHGGSTFLSCMSVTWAFSNSSTSACSMRHRAWLRQAPCHAWPMASQQGCSGAATDL